MQYLPIRDIAADVIHGQAEARKAETYGAVRDSPHRRWRVGPPSRIGLMTLPIKALQQSYLVPNLGWRGALWHLLLFSTRRPQKSM